MTPFLWMLGIVAFEAFVVWLFFGRPAVSRADQARDRIKAFVRANVGPLTPEDRATVLDEIVKWADEWVWDLCTGQEKEKPDGPPAP